MAFRKFSSQFGQHAFKAVLAAPLALLGVVFAWDDARFRYMRAVDPVAAWRLRPDDAVALGRYVERKLIKGELPSDRDAALARSGLAESALARGAVRTIGLVAERRRDLAAADKAMALSDALSRRDSLTQLWLIERSVRRNDIPGALKHYNRAMLVHPQLEAVLLPILVRALSVAEVRAGLAPYVSKSVPWALNLIERGIESDQINDLTALVIANRRNVSDPAFRTLISRLISKLSISGNTQLALRLVSSIWPELSSAFETIDVTPTTLDPRLGNLGWNFSSSGPIFAARNGSRGFDVSLSPLSEGIIASRIVPVREGGTYVFEHGIRTLETDWRSQLKWEALCMPLVPRNVIWSELLPMRLPGRYRWRLKVPSGCDAILLELSASSFDGNQTLTASIEGIKFSREP